MDKSIRKGAIFDSKRKYRYTLTRLWNHNNPSTALFIMYNPSTANEKEDDPTIRRCMSFAKSWGYGSMVIVNLFAYRTKNPKLLKHIFDPIGSKNDNWIKYYADSTDLIVVAWGAHKFARNRAQLVLRLLSEHELYCLCKTKDGSPKHPLYIKKDTVPIIYGDK